MPDHSSDTAAPGIVVDGAADVVAERPQRRPRRVRRTDWRLGGRTVLAWREGLLAIALMGLGAGILAGFAALQLGAPASVSTLLIWAGMLVAVVIAFARSRPIGLLRFRAVDLLWAVGLGLLARLVQGWVAGANGTAAPFPTLPTVDGQLANFWWLDSALAPVLIAPAVEEFFFRAVVLIALFTVLRRPFGALTSGLTALLVSTGLFVAAHAISATTATVEGLVSLGVLGGVCGLLVLLTGRIWGAVGVHLVFNALGVGLALLGSV